MKKMILKVCLIAGFCAAVPMFAQTSGRLTAKVPFQFNVNGVALPPGEYSFQEDANGVIMVSSMSEHRTVAVLTNTYSAGALATAPNVKFDKTGGQYSLSEVDLAGAPGRRLLK